ncbi:MAG: hypothetical protein BWZ08_02726 [candidate division BRC1 bacterium ADurb.BinA292]|nr:MAG: hypothetical protein BWZ08_02726 [candidate division BRC1 bacterium ADurb.BinA292]
MRRHDQQHFLHGIQPDARLNQAIGISLGVHPPRGDAADFNPLGIDRVFETRRDQHFAFRNRGCFVFGHEFQRRLQPRTAHHAARARLRRHRAGGEQRIAHGQHLRSVAVDHLDNADQPAERHDGITRGNAVLRAAVNHQDRPAIARQQAGHVGQQKLELRGGGPAAQARQPFQSPHAFDQLLVFQPRLAQLAAQPAVLLLGGPQCVDPLDLFDHPGGAHLDRLQVAGQHPPHAAPDPVGLIDAEALQRADRQPRHDERAQHEQTQTRTPGHRWRTRCRRHMQVLESEDFAGGRAGLLSSGLPRSIATQNSSREIRSHNPHPLPYLKVGRIAPAAGFPPCDCRNDVL